MNSEFLKAMTSFIARGYLRKSLFFLISSLYSNENPSLLFAYKLLAHVSSMPLIKFASMTLSARVEASLYPF